MYYKKNIEHYIQIGIIMLWVNLEEIKNYTLR